jgi:hypothetical protein
MADLEQPEIIDLVSPAVQEEPQPFFINLDETDQQDIVEIETTSSEDSNKMDIDEIIPKSNAM